jgi:hypothetical protein
MKQDEEDDIVNPESLPIFRKGKEIFDLVHKITDLIPEDNEYLMDVKGLILSDVAHSTKTLTMTSLFAVLRKILENEKRQICHSGRLF